jgi:hypothetical protein
MGDAAVRGWRRAPKRLTSRGRRLGGGLRGFLRKVVSDAARDRPVRVRARRISRCRHSPRKRAPPTSSRNALPERGLGFAHPTSDAGGFAQDRLSAA